MAFLTSLLYFPVILSPCEMAQNITFGFAKNISPGIHIYTQTHLIVLISVVFFFNNWLIDWLILSFFFTLESLAKIDFHWAWFFTSMKLKNGYVDWKISPGRPLTLILVSSQQN